MSVSEKVISIIAKTFNVEESEIDSGNSFYEDLGGNDLNFIELVMSCQKEFMIDIGEVEFPETYQVRDFIDLVISRL